MNKILKGLIFTGALYLSTVNAQAGTLSDAINNLYTRSVEVVASTPSNIKSSIKNGVKQIKDRTPVKVGSVGAYSNNRSHGITFSTLSADENSILDIDFERNGDKFKLGSVQYTTLLKSNMNSSLSGDAFYNANASGLGFGAERRFDYFGIKTFGKIGAMKTEKIFGAYGKIGVGKQLFEDLSINFGMDIDAFKDDVIYNGFVGANYQTNNYGTFGVDVGGSAFTGDPSVSLNWSVDLSNNNDDVYKPMKTSTR